MTQNYSKSVSRLALLTVIGSIAFYPISLFADEKTIKYKPTVDLSYRASTSRSIGELDSLVPLAQNDEHILLLDVRGRRAPHDDFEGNLGLAYRTLQNDRILGAYVFYDKRHTPEKLNPSQLTLGVEHLSEPFDFRSNVYIPENAKRKVKDRSLSVKVTHTQIQGLITSEQYARTLPGADVELGTAIPGLNHLSPDFTARAYLGYYHFERSGLKKVNGVRARAEFKLHDIDVMGNQSELTFGVEHQHDKVRGHNSAALLRARMPLSAGKKSNVQKLKPLERRMMEHIVRDVDIVTNKTPKRDVVAPVFLGNQEIKSVVYTSNNGTGDGSESNPMATSGISNLDAHTLIVPIDSPNQAVQVNGSTLSGGGELYFTSGDLVTAHTVQKQKLAVHNPLTLASSNLMNAELHTSNIHISADSEIDLNSVTHANGSNLRPEDIAAFRLSSILRDRNFVAEQPRSGAPAETENPKPAETENPKPAETENPEPVELNGDAPAPPPPPPMGGAAPTIPKTSLITLDSAFKAIFEEIIHSGKYPQLSILLKTGTATGHSPKLFLPSKTGDMVANKDLNEHIKRKYGFELLSHLQEKGADIDPHKIALVFAMIDKHFIPAVEDRLARRATTPSPKKSAAPKASAPDHVTELQSKFKKTKQKEHVETDYVALAKAQYFQPDPIENTENPGAGAPPPPAPPAPPMPSQAAPLKADLLSYVEAFEDKLPVLAREIGMSKDLLGKLLQEKPLREGALKGLDGRPSQAVLEKRLVESTNSTLAMLVGAQSHAAGKVIPQAEFESLQAALETYHADIFKQASKVRTIRASAPTAAVQSTTTATPVKHENFVDVLKAGIPAPVAAEENIINPTAGDKTAQAAQRAALEAMVARVLENPERYLPNTGGHNPEDDKDRASDPVFTGVQLADKVGNPNAPTVYDPAVARRTSTFNLLDHPLFPEQLSDELTTDNPRSKLNSVDKSALNRPVVIEMPKGWTAKRIEKKTEAETEAAEAEARKRPLPKPPAKKSLSRDARIAAAQASGKALPKRPTRKRR